jgi:glycosyltransferase involved in cell wall biosynthesis
MNSDVIHCHNYSLVRLIIFKKEVVITIHTIGVSIKYLDKYKKVFVISNAVKTDIEHRSNIEPILVYNGSKIDQILQKEAYTFETFRIVQVSRLDHTIKGQHILLEALKTIVHDKRIKNICIDFIGEGKSLDCLKKFVEDSHLEEYVNFLGIRNRKYISEHLKDYNLLVQPSIYEGFGLTIVEAMAARVPVLVSDIDGPMEIVDYGNHGYFFRTGNPKICAEKILIIMKDSLTSIFKTKMEEAASYVQTKFNIKITARLYLEHYRANINRTY